MRGGVLDRAFPPPRLSPHARRACADCLSGAEAAAAAVPSEAAGGGGATRATRGLLGRAGKGSPGAEKSFMVFLENVAPLVNSLNLGIVSPFLLGLPSLQLAQIKTQLALHQLNLVASNYSVASSPLLNEAFLKLAMFNPRGNMPQRPRGPSMPDPIPRGPFHRPGPGLQRQHPPNSDGMPQRFMGSEMRTGFPRPNIQVPQHRMDPRQAAERMNMEQQQQHQQQKIEGCGSHWDSPFPPGNNSQSQPIPGRMTDYPPTVQSRYTNESASSILASFGLSNEDLEELSRYPDDQLTPENMPLILRDIRMRKMTHQMPSLPHQSSEKENFRSEDGRGSMVKSKVIDYGHESKYGYDEGPLEVKVYGSEGSPKDTLKGFQTQQTPPAGITSKQMNAVEELIRQMGFQRSTPSTPSFFSMDTPSKMSGLCAPSTGTGVAPAVQPIMPPVGPPLPRPAMPPVRQALPPPSVARPMMSPMNQAPPPPPPPPPPFAPEMLGGMNRRERIHEESRPSPSAPPEPPPAHKSFRKEIDGPIKSPFGVVKASWLPVFSKMDAQKMKRLPTPSMMNDYYAASPRIFPHMCSLCNVECRHLKDWLQHQNSSTHLESCRQLRQQYPDWNPESHSSTKRREGDRNENSTPRRRSASISPRRSRRSSSGHARRRTRSRSRSPRHRLSRQRSRSPRPLPNFRHRSRSPWRPYNPISSFRRSSSRERGARRYIQSPDKALEAVMKCLGPRIVEHIHKQAFGQGFSGGRRTSPDFEDGKSGNPRFSPKPSKREGQSQHSSSESKTKVPEAPEGPSKEETTAEGKSKKPPSGMPVSEVDILASKFWSKPRSFGTILHIADLPEDVFTDQDIKKIVQPFGKVSDILVDRCKKEAYLEMNYKEAVIAAVKYNETSPVLINGKRVKISVAEKPKAASTQSKGNEKKVAQNIKDSAPNNKKEQITSVVKKTASLSSASKTDTKKPGKVVKSGETKVAAKAKKTIDGKKPGPVKENEAADPASLEEGKNPPKTKKPADSSKPLEPKAKEPLKTRKAAEPKDKEGLKVKKTGECKAKEPLKARKAMDAKARESLKAKKVVDNKKAGEAKAKKAAEPKKVGESDAKEPLKAKKVAESKESPKEQNAGEPSQAGESQDKEASKPADAPDKSEAVESPEAVESSGKDAEEMCVVMISSFPETGLSLEEIRNLTKPFGKVKDILIVSSHKKAYVEISRKSADSMVKFYTCFPMWVERNQLCISLVPELKDLNEEVIFTAMIKDANPSVNTETLYTQYVHLGNLPDEGYSELEILCVGLRFGRVDHYMVITNKNKAIFQLNSAESAASMCRFLKRYPYSLGEVELTVSRSPRIEPTAADAVRKEVKKQEAGQESPDLKTIPEGSGVVPSSAVPPTEATEDHGSDSEAIPNTETERLDSEKMGGEAASQPLKTKDLKEDPEALKKDFGLGAPSTGQDSKSSDLKAEEAGTLSSTLEKEEKETDRPDPELPRKASPPGGEKAKEELAPGKAEEFQGASNEETTGALSASATEEETRAGLGPGSTEAALQEMPSTDPLSSNRLASPEADRPEATVGLAETLAPRVKVKVKVEEELEGPSSASQVTAEVAEPAAAETKEKVKAQLLQMTRVEVILEKLPKDLISSAQEIKLEETPEEKAKVQNPEEIVTKTPQGKGPGQAEAEESCKASAPEAETVADSEAAPVPKALNPPKTRLSARRKEKKPAGKPATKSPGVAEKTPAPKPTSQQRPANGRSNVPDSAKSKLSMSSVVVALGGGKSSSQQDKDPPAETKGSPKQSREQDSRSSNLKRDAAGNKVSAERNTRSSKSNPKPKEEEELFPFNLDEFVTMDEVVDEAEPPQPRKNPVRGKRKEPPKKNLPCEPSSKRKKGKGVAGPAAESEVSFVTLDEIGEDEGGMGQADLLSLEAMTDDGQGLVTVDEVNEEEELIDEDIKDPQSLVTLDEISEQEDITLPETAKGPFAPGESEPDLKTEPLVTVDEIGEVEELPLNQLSQFKDEEMLKCKEDEKGGLEDAGDFLSSQIPDDPSILVTVDEIHEDSDDQPLMTIDEVTEDDEDFLEDFNRLKEEFSFVTVDEVGSEEEEEDKPGTSASRNLEGATKMAPEERAEENLQSSVESENFKIPAKPPLERRESARGEPLEGEASAGHLGGSEDESPAEEEVERGRKKTELEHKDKEEGKDVEQTDTLTESDSGCKQLQTEPVGNQKEESSSKGSDSQEEQQSLGGVRPGEDPAAEAIEMEVEGSSAATSEEERKGDAVAMPSPSPGISTEGMAAGEPQAASKPAAQSPELSPDTVLGKDSEAAPLQPSEKPCRDRMESKCEEPESKQRKVDSSEKPKPPSQLKDLDFLVPKAGYFCQICSCFCVDEASMKSHCQSQLHQQNMEKFIIKSPAEEKEKEDTEKESLT
ncbi:zinc finger protein 638 isoform X2 [Ahaetulla prasina]|uniref:zinc finger protein 638 isoform X2 n=1 Tax=Ahaetulla prasina TaxID=499056 RepID=UPI002649F4C8|nr:zinc finger protein 638 isoform X2 [Ahaetulla prasina]